MRDRDLVELSLLKEVMLEHAKDPDDPYHLFANFLLIKWSGVPYPLKGETEWYWNGGGL